MKLKRLVKLLPLLIAAAFLLLFRVLYQYDNKYKTPPPYGRDGVIEFTQADISRSRPLFLIDGWLLTDNRLKNNPTYIGEYSNLQRSDPLQSPHGTANYQLVLRYRGEPVVVTLNFPQLYSQHTIWLDKQIVSKASGSARISFTLTAGDHLLMVETRSSRGYYSGMYHPPALGEAQKMYRAVLIQCIAYAFAFFAPLVLALFTRALWRSVQNKTPLWFGLLCLSFSAYISYYFVRLLGFPFAEYWFFLQSVALYALCFCVVQLTALSGGLEGTKWVVWSRYILLCLFSLLTALSVLIPLFPWAVKLHSNFANLTFVFVFGFVLLLAVLRKKKNGAEETFTLLACTVFGVGLLMNLFFSNLFEPILFFWQFEWCGLFLVALFGATMSAQNKRILSENEMFQSRLEQLVEKRTEALTNLLQERKAFFADMAHDLKAPIFATQAFIQAIRQNDTGVDGVLLQYIDMVEQKQREMALRVRGMTVLDQMDDLQDPATEISVQTLLQEIYKTYHMEAEVASIHLKTELLGANGTLFAPLQKLLTVFENLLVNAIRATPPDGKITVSAEIDAEGCHFAVSDTGCGISGEEMPFIFDRFFIGKQNKNGSNGLGLYIVKNIVDELNGTISVSSKPGHGTTFYLDFPLIKS